VCQSPSAVLYQRLIHKLHQPNESSERQKYDSGEISPYGHTATTVKFDGRSDFGGSPAPVNGSIPANFFRKKPSACTLLARIGDSLR
jgi:hypothetical protein